ncbi:hypothetical protein [Paracoccus sediminicola]|uniref:hypothetical protein n=1 Tax=Paracoccus sediminicola TaxID=3017783 RepID=UPI0022F1270B|nr:hypothetical protein [Paracoccus sediminicola]WBU58569.1 hypothetical protein PAF18_15840 [Paracoccus sediminicola]
MSELTPHIKCDVELSVSGPAERTVASWTAAALRRIADKLEQCEYEDGHHEVTDGSRRPIGSCRFS